MSVPYRYVDSLRLSIFERDKFTCQNCLKKIEPDYYAFNIFGGLELHHKDHNHKNNNEENLITFCSECHLKIGHKGNFKK